MKLGTDVDKDIVIPFCEGTKVNGDFIKAYWSVWQVVNFGHGIEKGLCKLAYMYEI